MSERQIKYSLTKWYKQNLISFGLVRYYFAIYIIKKKGIRKREKVTIYYPVPILNTILKLNDNAKLKEEKKRMCSYGKRWILNKIKEVVFNDNVVSREFVNVKPNIFGKLAMETHLGWEDNHKYKSKGNLNE